MRRPQRLWPRLAKGRDRGIDDARICRAYGLIAHAQTVDDARAKRLDHHIGGLGKVEEGRDIGRVLQVQHNRFLAAVGVAKPDRLAVLAVAHIAHRLAGWRFDLDHLGPMVGQHLRQHRTRQELRQVQNAKALHLHDSPPITEREARVFSSASE